VGEKSLRFYKHSRSGITVSFAPLPGTYIQISIPRFRDKIIEEFCDSFGSDMHTIVEEEGQGEIYVSMSTPREILDTIKGLVEEITYYLKKM
jgi:hypothetical protein